MIRLSDSLCLHINDSFMQDLSGKLSKELKKFGIASTTNGIRYANINSW